MYRRSNKVDRKQNERIASITENTMVVGCDIGSSIHYGRAFNYRGMELSGKPFRFANDQAGFKSLTVWMERFKAQNGLAEVVIGFEPTGHYWFNLGSYLKSAGLRMVMVNPAHVKRTKEFDDNTQDKNDRNV
jgi:transposase